MRLADPGYLTVMPGFMPGIHVFLASNKARRGWHPQLGRTELRTFF